MRGAGLEHQVASLARQHERPAEPMTGADDLPREAVGQLSCAYVGLPGPSMMSFEIRAGSIVAGCPGWSAYLVCAGHFARAEQHDLAGRLNWR